MNIQPISYKQNTTFKAKSDILSKDLTPAAIKTICSEIKKATGVNVNKDLLQGDYFVKPSGELRHPRMYDDINCVYRDEAGKLIKYIEFYPDNGLNHYWGVRIVEECIPGGGRLVKYYERFTKYEDRPNGDITGVKFYQTRRRGGGKSLDFDIDANGNVSRIQQFP